jgi:hypothetical protein
MHEIVLARSFPIDGQLQVYADLLASKTPIAKKVSLKEEEPDKEPMALAFILFLSSIENVLDISA